MSAPSSVNADPLNVVAASLGAGNVVARFVSGASGAGALVMDPHAGMWVGAGWAALEAEKDALVAGDRTKIKAEVAAILAGNAADRAAAFAVRAGVAPFLSPVHQQDKITGRGVGDDEEDDLTDDSIKGDWKLVAAPDNDVDDIQVWQPAKRQRSTLDKWVGKK